jgi:hypothetical protein
MKKLLIVALALGTITSFAGTLTSKHSLERLEFNLNSSSNTLSIVSTSPRVSSKDIQLNSISRDKSGIKLFAATKSISDGDSEFDVGAYPFTLIYDVVLLPFKSSVKALKSKQLHKDYVVLLQAINSNVEVTVSQKRFERISNLLN